MKTILFAAALLLGLAQADEEYVQTQVFATRDFHEFNTLDRSALGGIIVGWVLYALIVVVSFVLVFKATLDRSREYEQNLENAKKEMKNLGINLAEVDSEFDEIQNGLVKVEEQVDLIDIALEEGKKMRGATNQA